MGLERVHGASPIEAIEHHHHQLNREVLRKREIIPSVLKSIPDQRVLLRKPEESRRRRRVAAILSRYQYRSLLDQSLLQLPNDQSTLIVQRPNQQQPGSQQTTRVDTPQDRSQPRLVSNNHPRKKLSTNKGLASALV